MHDVTTIFWDLGGVLLSNGWDSEQRARAISHFGLERDEFEDRHREAVPSLEMGRCSLDDYLRMTVFYRERPFTEGDFRQYMKVQSTAFAENLEVVAEIAAAGRYLLATLNNESRELNEYRIERFGLRRYFTVFFTSSFLGVMKPSTAIYRTALDVVQRPAEEVVYIDDREQNLEPARSLDVRTLHFRGEQGPGALRRGLTRLGVDL